VKDLLHSRGMRNDGRGGPARSFQGVHGQLIHAPYFLLELLALDTPSRAKPTIVAGISACVALTAKERVRVRNGEARVSKTDVGSIERRPQSYSVPEYLGPVAPINSEAVAP
jgi:hypothetical protein